MPELRIVNMSKPFTRRAMLGQARVEAVAVPLVVRAVVTAVAMAEADAAAGDVAEAVIKANV